MIRRFVAVGVAMLALSTGSPALASYIYDLRMNQDGFVGDVRFTETTILTELATITAFDNNTLTAPDDNLASTVILSPLPGGADCVVGPFASAFAPCFGVRFAGIPESDAVNGDVGRFTSVGIYGDPGRFSLLIHAAPEPSSLLLLLAGIGASLFPTFCNATRPGG